MPTYFCSGWLGAAVVTDRATLRHLLSAGCTSYFFERWGLGCSLQACVPKVQRALKDTRWAAKIPVFWGVKCACTKASHSFYFIFGGSAVCIRSESRIYASSIDVAGGRRRCLYAQRFVCQLPDESPGGSSLYTCLRRKQISSLYCKTSLPSITSTSFSTSSPFAPHARKLRVAGLASKGPPASFFPACFTADQAPSPVGCRL